MKSGSDKIYFDGRNAYLEGSAAAVTIKYDDSSTLFVKPADGQSAVSLTKKVKGTGKTSLNYVKWGKNNKLPIEVRNKVFANEMTATNIKNAIEYAYGGGLVTGTYEEGPRGLEFKYRKFDEWEAFAENNDIPQYLMKMLSDLCMYYSSWTEILINGNRQVTGISCKQAIYSRIEERDRFGKIKHHFYSGLFYEGKTPSSESDVAVTEMLDDELTVLDAKQRMGIIPNAQGRMVDEKASRYVVPVYYPSGEPYYQRPHWWSIFESGWYDFAVAIPKFKKAIMKNQMTIKYHVSIHQDYFPELFKIEGITEEKKKIERKREELNSLNEFLSDVENSGKSFVSYRKYNHLSKTMEEMITITALDNHYKGGEYIEDAEESSNILSYGMGQHPSLNGSAPGKNKTINGTEARELFIMKQAMQAPLRHLALKPFYIIKALNKWPAEMQFGIVNTVLTTLDKGTGSEKVIS